MIRRADQLLLRLRAIHASIRDSVLAACERSALETLAAPAGDAAGDTIFAIDRVGEAALLEGFAALAAEWPCLLIAEGLGHTGRATLPAGLDPARAEIVVLVDPIDGTRGLMYQKRPAWILTGVAANRGPSTSLGDVELALQTEIPLVKQHLCDSLWLCEGQVGGERWNRLTGTAEPLRPRPSAATTIAHGFGSICRFFPGQRVVLAAIDDRLVERLLGPPPPGRAVAFEDQYISTGGQLYELMMGHDRWVADLRPLVWLAVGERGLCCHPYDLATESIARAAGVQVTDDRGQQLSAPFDVEHACAWIGYANAAIRSQVEPVLMDLLAPFRIR